jgi:hypothetical protein
MRDTHVISEIAEYIAPHVLWVKTARNNELEFVSEPIYIPMSIRRKIKSLEQRYIRMDYFSATAMAKNYGHSNSIIGANYRILFKDTITTEGLRELFSELVGIPFYNY